MAVMALNHANACAHLHSKCVDIHSIVEQRKGRIGVTQAVQRAVLVRSQVLSDKLEHP